MVSTKSQDLYPGPRTYSESERLQAQHLLYKTYLGYVLAPLDLKKTGFRVLDAGTADGFWLVDLLPQLASDAVLVGTDVAKYETNIVLPPNMTLALQNIKDPWPADWNSSFNLVHERLVLSNVADHTAAVQAVRRMFELVKPGGWIQLDESAALEGPIVDSDTPSDKVFRVCGNFMRMCGMDPAPGDRVKAVLEEAAVGLIDGEVYFKSADAKLGHGAAPLEVAKAGMTQLMGVMDAIKGGLSKLPKPPMSPEDFEKLRPAVVEQLETTGATTRLVAVWAKRRV